MGTGNHEHWSASFVARNRTWLLIQATKTCRNPVDAEDLVQEALLRFLREFSEVVEPLDDGRCGSWVMKAIGTIFVDQCRRQRVREHNAKDPTLHNEVVEPHEPAPPSLYDTVTDESFARAMASLSPKLRATYELHAAGHRYQDIARKLGIQMGAVAKRLHDARARLRDYFKSGDDSDGPPV